ncbi:MAG: MFS transporter [Bacillota bacterium]|nr:MFS transporter [Bacillota bacterium]
MVSLTRRPGGSQWATARYTLIQASYWPCYCVIITFASVYLLHQGFRNTEIGIVISVAGVLSALLQPFVSRRADHLRRLALRQFAALLILGQVGLCLLLKCLPGRVPQILLYSGLLVLIQLILPLCSALGMDCLNRGIPLNFGAARGAGSIGFAVFSSLCGTLVLWFGEGVLPLVMLAVTLVLLLAVFTFRFRTPEGGEVASEGESSAGETTGGAFLLKYRGMVWILLGVVCLFLSHNILNTYAFQIVQPLGGTSREMGNMLFIQSVVELPVLFGFGLLLKRADSRFWVRICGAGFFLHALGELAAPNIPVIYAVQIFEMPGYALFTLASIYWINEIVAPEDRVQGQAYFAMAMTIGAVLAGFLGGFLLDRAGVVSLLAFSTAAGGAGMVLLLVLLGKKRDV